MRRTRNRDRGRGPGLAFTGRPANPYLLNLAPKHVQHNWPASAPVRSHPRMLLARLVRTRNDSLFLKGWASRPASKQGRRGRTLAA